MDTPQTSDAVALPSARAVRADLAAGELPADLTARVRALRDTLLTGLVERDVAIRLALLAALAGEHLLLVGPPGTAKSMVARRLHLAFQASTYFERLLTRFTVPEELFGPLSIKGLEEDRYERLTEAYLPTASIAFLDEIFKANSAILNALLTLLNEREFDNGTKRIATPLLSVVGASNELPEDEELDALFDRFLLRLHVGPVSKGGFRDLLSLRDSATPEPSAAIRLSAADLRAVQEAAEAVEVPDDVLVMLVELRDWCTAENIVVSDRRWRKVVKLLQVSALTNGRERVSVWDCWLLQHCVWDRPEDREKVYGWYAKRVGASAAMDPSRLTRIVVSWEGRLKADQDSRSQVRDAQGRLLYKGADGKPTASLKGKTQAKRGAEPLYLAPATVFDVRLGGDRTNGGAGYTVSELNKLRVRVVLGPVVYFQHWGDRETYLADKSNWHVVDLEQPALTEPTRHKEMYVGACLGEIDRLRAEITSYQASLVEHMRGLKADIQSHLWITSDFAAPATQALLGTAAEVQGLLARVEKVRKGFELLPRDEAADTQPGDDLP